MTKIEQDLKLRRSKIVRFLILLIFLGFLGSISLFNHSHIHDGNIIVHSHPFKKGADGNPIHNHNNSSYQLIQLLTGFIAIIAVCFSAATLIRFNTGEILIQSKFSPVATVPVASFFRRGPPVQKIA